MLNCKIINRANSVIFGSRCSESCLPNIKDRQNAFGNKSSSSLSHSASTSKITETPSPFHSNKPKTIPFYSAHHPINKHHLITDFLLCIVFFSETPQLHCYFVFFINLSQFPIAPLFALFMSPIHLTDSI